MNTPNTTVAVILYKSKKLANGEHPLVLRITKNRKRKYKYLGISCPTKLWDEEENLPRKNHPQKKVLDAIIQRKISEYKDQVLELYNEGKDYTPYSLVQAVEKPIRKTTVLKFFDETIKELKDSKKVGNAGVYKDARNRLSKFLEGNDISFSDIDYPFLLKFEAFQRKNNNSDNAISVRFRTLRALYNKAISVKAAKESSYPFRKFEFSKFNTTTRKRAITKENIGQIEKLKLDPKSSLFFSRQIFLFSYYGLGINFVDIANLKWKNIIEDRVFYKRAKTGKELTFKLMGKPMEIIKYWKKLTGGNPENYVFNILDGKKHITPTQIDNRAMKILGKVNTDLKIIGEKAKIEIPLTTYVARHTSAQVLKRSGTSIAIISQALGHKTEAITQIYLKSFENDIVDEAQTNL